MTSLPPPEPTAVVPEGEGPTGPSGGRSVTRRTVLAGAVAGGAAVAVGGLTGTARAGTVGATQAALPTQADLARRNIKHVVFLMMENRSFDHIYGSLSGVRGFDDRTVTRPNGTTIFAQPDPVTGKDELPFRISQSNNAAGDTDLSHNWGPQHLSLNGGTNDNWIGAHRTADGNAHGPLTMAYLTRADAPYHYAMADAFTICDNYFCSNLGPTYPNRLLWQMGTLDADAVGGGPLVTTDESVFTGNANTGVFTFPTYPERLTKAGVTWKAYTEPASNHLLNMFPCLKQYNKATATPVTDPEGYTNFTSGTAGATSGAFLADVQNNSLPQVSWIFPTAQSTEHPGNGPINNGPQYYEPIITALMQSPSWSSTALFITWDENDGYFDHVPPPQAPPGTAGEFLKGPVFGRTATNDPAAGISGPVGLGFRVPNLVISPWSTGGRVNSELFDHVSCLKLVETLFGVPLAGIASDWRLATVGDLTSTFDFSSATPAGPPPAALQAAYTASQQLLVTNNSGVETVPAVQTMPTQETTPVRPRVGPAPAFGPTGPVAALPEVGVPALLLAGGLVAATSAVALKRIRSGGASDASQAGGPARTDRDVSAPLPG